MEQQKTLGEEMQYGVTIPHGEIRRRAESGEGVRATDIPVKNPLYFTLESVRTLAQEASALKEIAVEIPSPTGSVKKTAVAGEGPKLFSDAMPPSSLDPMIRKDVIASTLAQKIFDLIRESSSGEMRERDLGPYVFLQKQGETYVELEAEDLKNLGIALNGGSSRVGVFSELVSVIGSKLTTLLQMSGCFGSGKQEFVVSLLQGAGSSLSFKIQRKAV